MFSANTLTMVLSVAVLAPFLFFQYIYLVGCEWGKAAKIYAYGESFLGALLLMSQYHEIFPKQMILLIPYVLLTLIVLEIIAIINAHIKMSNMAMIASMLSLLWTVLVWAASTFTVS